jgi:signal transduction histidine kinase
MEFVVEDLLDFAQLKNEKFRKNIELFNVHDAIEEVVNIQKAKAAA